MLMLSLDSSAKSAAVGVTNGEKVLASGFENSGFTHSQTLLKLVDSTLKKADKDIDEIEAFALTVGPGSFTGLRIGCALVMGLAGNRMCYPVSILKALAYNLQNKEGNVVCALNARCNQVYMAAFSIHDRVLIRIIDDCAISIDQAVIKAKEILSDNKPLHVIGDGAFLLDELKDLGAIFFNDNTNFIQAYSVAVAARDESPVPAKDIKLCYLRLSQAERERLNKMEEMKK